MESLAPLSTIAEVSVAFAGFASIVSILGIQNRGRVPIFYRASVRGMLLCSLTAVIAALAPYVFIRFAADVDTAWRHAAVFFVVLLIALNAAGIADGRAIRHLTPWYGRALGGLLLLAPLTLTALAAIGLPENAAASFYVLSLWLLLMVAAYLFASTVLVLISWRDRGGDA